MITIPFLPQYTIVLSDRKDGSFRGEQKVSAFLHHHGIEKDIAVLHIEHGSRRVHLKNNDQGAEYLGDALVTKNPELCLAMVVADCFPIIFHDPKSHTVALIHGGWRSLLQNIIDLTMLEVCADPYRCDPKRSIAWIGPGLQSASNRSHLSPVQSLFSEWAPFVNQRDQDYTVDLAQYIEASFMRNAVMSENIFQYGKDTYVERDTFFSHRRATQEGDDDGRFIVAIYKN